MKRRKFYGNPLEIIGRDPVEFEVEEIVEFVFDYKSKEKLACGIKHCRQQHNEGFVVRLESGEKSIIGHVCAEDRMEDGTFAIHASKLRSAQRVEEVQETLSNPDFRPEVAFEAAKSWQDTVMAADAIQRKFHADAGLIWRSLQFIAENGGLLAPGRYAGDKFEYGRFDARGIFVVERPIGKASLENILRGIEFFRIKNLTGDYLHAIRLLKGIAESIDGCAAATEKRLISLPKEIREARSLLMRVQRAIDGYSDFREHESLKSVIRWAHQIGTCQ